MKSLKDLLIKKRTTISQELDDKTVFYIFKKIIKEEFGNIGVEKLKPDFYKNKTIFIKPINSVWAAELWSNRVKIIRKINIEIGREVVKKIKTK